MTRSIAAHAIVCGIATAAAVPAHADETSSYTNADEVRAIVSEMLADAEDRSSLLASAGAGGYDGAFYLASTDGSFRLAVTGLLQFRYHLNFRDGDEPIGSEFDSGFSTPRTLLFFKGNVISPKLFYQIRVNFRADGGEMVLDDAFVGYKFNDNWSLRWGQALTAFSHEWFHGDLKLQTIERSIVALSFGEQRQQLIDLTYKDENLRVIGTFGDGFRSQNTDFDADPADWALSLRGEWKLAGEWSDVLGKYSSFPGSELAAMLGAAVHFEQGPNVNGGLAEQNLLAWTVDGIVEGDGWSVFATATGYHTEDEAGVSGADFDEYGVSVQGGFFVHEEVEIYGRYSGLFPDGDRAGDDAFNSITLGLNWFIHGFAARFTVQAEWFLDPTTDTVIGNHGNTGGRNPASPLFNLRPSDEGDQIAITAQFQLMF